MSALANQLQTNFRLNVASIMRRRGITQTALAASMGKTQGYISHLVSGKKSVKNGLGLDTVERIAAALEVEPHLLLNPPADN